MIIDDENSLAEFRNQNAGRVIIDHLASHPQMLVALPVGVGKSYNMDEVIEEAVRGRHYQTVIVLVATRAIINERRWILAPPSDVKITNLLPRPQKMCGDLNPQWSDYEKRGLSQYARQNLCSKCLHQESCSWLKQYGSNLSGTQVIFATQTHYENNPQFIELLVSWSCASKALVVIDEAGFLMNLPRVTISRSDLERFSDVLHKLLRLHGRKLFKEWSHFVDVLLMTTTKDLQTPGVWRLYELESSNVNLIQAAGVDTYPDDFCYLGGVLMQLCQAHPYSRERLQNGDISFAQILNISSDFIVYSGTTELELLQYRLDQKCFDLYRELQFRHKQTRWYNIATTLAADRHFKKNAPQILGFFATLIYKRVLEGKRVLLVAKKCHKELCEQQLNNEFHANNNGIVAKATFTDWDLADKQVVPIIHYGVIGINSFEHF
jgi:hypothetical protein